MNAPDKNTSNLNLFRALGLGMELGINIALPLLAGVLAGQWLDRRLGTGGLVTVLLILAGLAAGGYNCLRVLTRELRDK